MNTGFPDLLRKLARFDLGPCGYRADLAMQRQTGQGWEKYYDLAPAQREAAPSDIVSNLNKGTGEERAFARGWLDARDAALRATQADSPTKPRQTI
jgi:hypothetical protein